MRYADRIEQCSAVCEQKFCGPHHRYCRSQLKTPENDRYAVANVSSGINERIAKKQVHSLR